MRLAIALGVVIAPVIAAFALYHYGLARREKRGRDDRS